MVYNNTTIAVLYGTDGNGGDSWMLVCSDGGSVRVWGAKRERHMQKIRGPSCVLQDVQTGRRRAAGKYFSSFTATTLALALCGGMNQGGGGPDGDGWTRGVQGEVEVEVEVKVDVEVEGYLDDERKGKVTKGKTIKSFTRLTKLGLLTAGCWLLAAGWTNARNRWDGKREPWMEAWCLSVLVCLCELVRWLPSSSALLPNTWK
ncbi:hypothetical protein QBC41DRAFT_3067 [Cercophora samala]|uniref:Uncharacterized protein n=1 Tax=Cercophora samala TaxID=330535 RepID=A0AA39ZNR6_9PEZI|nr:hypothetical protein QBC41DRAFT_3067 [Cercophora samala]